MFHCTDIDMLMATDSVVNAAFQVEIDTWRGRKSVKAMLQSVTPARTCPALEACLEPENLSFAADLYATSDAELCEDCCESPEDIEAYEAEREKNRALWEQKAQSDPDALEDAVVRAIIGDRELHKSQRVVLSSLRAGNSVLAVMATGRGKSLTFQVHTACEALAHHTASLFVYPLRALIADQAFHINEALAPFGINACTLTGESAPDERRQAFAGLTDGSVDIVLTTPEFLVCHAPEFAATGRIGFVVVDEAHHIGLSRAGHRPAYAQLGSAIAQMGNPVVLALTATSDEAVTSDIDRVLPVAGHVVDDTMRTNLHVVDQRNLRNRGDYLATLVAQGEKSVIYVSSREQSVALARNLRKRVPQMAPLHRLLQRGSFACRAHACRGAVPHGRDRGARGHVGVRRGRGHSRHPQRRALPAAVQRDRVQPDERPCGARRQGRARASAVRALGREAQRPRLAGHDARSRCAC